MSIDFKKKKRFVKERRNLPTDTVIHNMRSTELQST